VEVKWPPGLSIDEILSKVTLVFQDIDPNDQSNTFEAELSIRDAFQLAKKHHVTAGEYVAKRYGGTLFYDRDWISPSDEETKQEADR
jgi:hypothetical protein